MFWYALQFCSAPSEGRVVPAAIVLQYWRPGSTKFRIVSDSCISREAAVNRLKVSGVNIIQSLPDGKRYY